MDDVVMVHGLPWPCGRGIAEEKVEALTRLPAREDDIFIASYPRSGLKLLNRFLIVSAKCVQFQSHCDQTVKSPHL